MLLFLGGAARTGKGIIAHRLLREQHIPYLSLDVLKMSLTRGMPAVGITPDAGARVVAEQLWPLVREMTPNLIGEGVPYLIEGEVLPYQVAELRERNPGRVAACFLGYAHISPTQKLAEIRQIGGSRNDWPAELTDAALLAIIEREIGFSLYLWEECRIHDFPYFDTSLSFAETLERVVVEMTVLVNTNNGGLL